MRGLWLSALRLDTAVLETSGDLLRITTEPQALYILSPKGANQAVNGTKLQ